MVKLSVCCIVIVYSACSFMPVTKKTVHSKDLFENTIVEDVASAILEGDTLLLKNEIAKLSDNEINYQEPIFGSTLLYWSTFNGFDSCVEILCRSGAKTDIPVTNGDVALFNSIIRFNLETTKILLAYKADPNYCVWDSTYLRCNKTPVLIASGLDLEILKFVIRNGGDPTAFYPSRFFHSALAEACASGKIENVNYLVFDCHVDFDDPLFKRFDGTNVYITEELREMTFELNSPQHIEKMRLVAFLKEQGMDYYNTPVPERLKQWFDEDYLSKY